MYASTRNGKITGLNAKIGIWFLTGGQLSHCNVDDDINYIQSVYRAVRSFVYVARSRHQHDASYAYTSGGINMDVSNI